MTRVQEKYLPFGPPKIYFPEDEGAHPEMLTEWWYGNFGLTDSKGLLQCRTQDNIGL